MPVVIRTFEEAGQRLTLRNLGTHHELLLGQVPILSSAALATEQAFGALAQGMGAGARGRARLRRDAPRRARRDGAGRRGHRRREARHRRGPAPRRARLPRAGRRSTIRASAWSRTTWPSAIAGARGLDAILLDVDNGPGWASFRQNARLYTPAGLAEARAALRQGGALAVWSGYPADAFVGQLRRAGFAPEVVLLRERGAVRARAYVGRAR